MFCPYSEAVWQAVAPGGFPYHGPAREQANPTIEGRRAQLLANEWILRRNNVDGVKGVQLAQSTKNSMCNGFRQSAAVVCKLSLLHPELAVGFHHLARLRAGGYQSWKRLCKFKEVSDTELKKQKKKDIRKVKQKVVQYQSHFDKRGCPCCEEMNDCWCATEISRCGPCKDSKKRGDDNNGGFVSDSLHHFLFECKNEELVQIRKRLCFQERSGMLAEEVVVASGVTRDSLVWSQHSERCSIDRGGSNSRGIDIESMQQATLPPSTANLIMGGHQIYVNSVKGKREVHTDRATANTSTSRKRHSLFDLANWKPKGPEQNALEEAIGGILRYERKFKPKQKPGDARKPPKAEKAANQKPLVQEYRLLNAGCVLVAQYLQQATPVRNAIIWPNPSSSSQCPKGTAGLNS